MVSFIHLSVLLRRSGISAGNCFSFYQAFLGLADSYICSLTLWISPSSSCWIFVCPVVHIRELQNHPRSIWNTIITPGQLIGRLCSPLSSSQAFVDVQDNPARIKISLMRISVDVSTRNGTMYRKSVTSTNSTSKFEPSTQCVSSEPSYSRLH
jgi:hypothetical protein